MNRLASSTSPYLQQHASNPVDWWEWGDAAFAEAKKRDVPVLLSVGYAACHWCHVMAHESFEDPATAAVMNAGFVNVKVDREERPDVDAVYMAATQALTGSGGWPMTVFLTTEGKPFYAGTYFPPAPGRGIPAFTQVLDAVTRTWTERRAELDEAAERIAAGLAQAGESDPGPGPAPSRRGHAEHLHTLVAQEDSRHGGFGQAPKFPPSTELEFLLRLAGSDADETDRAAALGLAGRTLRAMAGSGLYDQVAGGFARYCVDRSWTVPHFEKMLYDNALLALAYLNWWRLTGEPLGARIAVETCEWMLAELGTADGGLASSLDADTPVTDADGHVRGVEGHTYVWTPAELAAVLGPQDGAWVAERFGVSAAGTFEHGTSTLCPRHDPATGEAADVARWQRLRPALRAARAQRPQPARDDKVVTAWNGLAISALARTGALLERPDLVAAAVRVADLLSSVHLVERRSGSAGPVGSAGSVGSVRSVRSSRDGTAGAAAGVLEDYGDLADGLLELFAVTGRTEYLHTAGELLETVLEHFPAEGGGFYDTAADRTDPQLAAVRRPREAADSPAPSGASAVAGALLRYAALTGSARHRTAAEGALFAAEAAAQRYPRAFGWALAVGEAWLDGPREVAVVGADGDPARDRLHRVALAATAPGAAVAVGEPDAAGVPLLAGRGTAEGRSAAYVCRHFTCERPTADPAELARQVGARQDGPGE